MSEGARVRRVEIGAVLRDCERFLIQERGLAPATGKEYCRKAGFSSRRGSMSNSVGGVCIVSCPPPGRVGPGS
jgi:hypothetical protein